MDLVFTDAEAISKGTEQQVDGFLLGMMTGINYLIKATATADGFNCSVEVDEYDANGMTPNNVFQILAILRDRGFRVVYDGSYYSDIGEDGLTIVDYTGNRIVTTPYVGNIDISWNYPNMNEAEAALVQFPLKSNIQYLGYDFRASTVYLYQTEGHDLRQYTPVVCARDIEREVRRISVLGKNILVYSGPNSAFYGVSGGTLASLYKELLLALIKAHYDVEFVGSTLVIMWNSFRALSFDGVSVVAELTTSALPQPPHEYAYVHTQTVPSTMWIIDHNLGFIPSVELINSFGVEFEAEVINVTVNRTIVQMNVPLSGFARLT